MTDDEYLETLPPGVDPEVIKRALSAKAKRAAYNKKRYYQERYGIDLSDIKESMITVKGPRGTHPLVLYEAQSSRGEHGFRSKVVVKHPKLDKGFAVIDGQPGWYAATDLTSKPPSFYHVAFGDDLISRADEMSRPLWDLVLPARWNSRLLGQASMLGMVRGLLARVCAYTVLQSYFTVRIEDQTVGDLLEQWYAAKAWGDIPYDSTLRDGTTAFRLYFESVDLYRVDWFSGFSATVGEVVEAGRTLITDFKLSRKVAEQRAIFLRNKIADQFGFKLSGEAEHPGGFTRGRVFVGLDGTVLINNDYVCVVPYNEYQGDRGSEYAYPTGDIVAAKMLSLATDARLQVSTLSPYIRVLEETFANNPGTFSSN